MELYTLTAYRNSNTIQSRNNNNNIKVIIILMCNDSVVLRQFLLDQRPKKN